MEKVTIAIRNALDRVFNHPKSSMMGLVIVVFLGMYVKHYISLDEMIKGLTALGAVAYFAKKDDKTDQ